MEGAGSRAGAGRLFGEPEIVYNYLRQSIYFHFLKTNNERKSRNAFHFYLFHKSLHLMGILFVVMICILYMRWLVDNRMPRKHTTKYLLTKFLHFGVLLMNQEHVPLGVIIKDKKKTFSFGSSNIKERLDDHLKNDEAFKNSIKTDQEEMNQATDSDYYQEAPEKAYGSLIASLGPSLLPFPVDFMNHDELYKWVITEIWQDAVSRGVQTKSGQVIFKDPRFKPVWWPEDVWKWENTKSFSKVTKIFWSKLKLNYEFVTFLKICVKLCLEHHDIQAEDVPLENPREDWSDSSQEDNNRTRGRYVLRPPGEGNFTSSSSGSSGHHPSTPSIINFQPGSSSSVNLSRPSPSSSAGVLPRSSPSLPSEAPSPSQPSSPSSGLPSLHSRTPSPSRPPSSPSQPSPSAPLSPIFPSRGRRQPPEAFNVAGGSSGVHGRGRGQGRGRGRGRGRGQGQD